ncbi:MAG: hypothetical protein PUF10_02305 [Bacteroidales bacterium]|nr:hypothetical protein [Bacteroidales bacterium]
MKGFRVICVIRGCFVFRGITHLALPYLPPVPRADTRGYNVAFTLHESLFWRFSESLIS